jgi:hypothetical protein
MFIQVITGKVKDPAGFRRASDRWDAELRPGAKGTSVAPVASLMMDGSS